MTIKGVIVGIANWIRRTVSRIGAFLTSDEFNKFIHGLVTWIESAVLWLGEKITGLVVVVARFVKSDSFRDGIRRGREQVILACDQALRGVKWVAHWLYAMATSGFVKTGIATTADLIHLCLPKRCQRMIAAASIIFVVMVLVFLVPESERTEQVPETASIKSVPETTGTKSVPETTGTKSVPETTGTKSGLQIKRITSGMPDFAEIPAGRERKAAFFGYFLPIVEKENETILKTRQRLHDWHQNRDQVSSQEASEISKISTRYRIDDFDTESDNSWEKLLNRVDVVPPSLAMAQSANESAWGTSRFARKGYNFFGQWCFKKGCGLVPKKRDANKTHEVAAFDSPQESVKMYIRNLNSNSAYKPLRDLRAELRRSNKPVTGYELAAGLNRYSERGQEYVRELREMISFNKLAEYDTF
jgi:Bax protein